MAKFRRFLSRLGQSVGLDKNGSTTSYVGASQASGAQSLPFPILEVLQNAGLLRFLLNRTTPSVIVADADLIDFLRANQKELRPAELLSVQDIMSRRLAKAFRGPYYILTRGSEHAVKHALRGLLAEMGRQPDIQGVFNDVLAARQSARANPLAGFESAWESYRTIPRYIVLCAPRSGSEFLVRNLESSGIGAPREHIPTHLNAVFRPVDGSRPGGLDFIHWFVTLIHHASVNNIFGTKLISHVYRDLEASLNREEKHFLNEIMAQSVLVHLYRSNKLLQALSFDRALTTQHWHFYEGHGTPEYQKLSDGWTYDFRRIANGVGLLNNEERSIYGVWKRHAGERGLSVCYESLDAEAVRQHILAALNVPSVEPGPELTTNILRDERTADYAQRFLADYRKRYSAADPKTHLPLRVAVVDGKLTTDPSPDSLIET